MIVRKTNFPQDSVLFAPGYKYDYVDSYHGEFYDPANKITSVDIGRSFFSSGPKWVGKLFNFRNKFVSLFGLKTHVDMIDRDKQIENFTCEPGERLGLFRVYSKTEKEVIIGEDDKHLNFRVSLLFNQLSNDPHKKDLIVSTTVEYHNWFGRLYFIPVRPFHQIIVPAILQGMIKELEKKNG